MGGARGGEGGVGGGWCVCFFLGGASGCVVVSVGGVVLLMLWDWVGWGGLVRVISYIVVITLLLYRFYCRTFSYIHTSFFSYGAGSLFYVRGLLIVHFEVMVSRDSVESTPCLVSQGLTVPCGGSSSRSPPRLARSLWAGFFLHSIVIRSDRVISQDSSFRTPCASPGASTHLHMQMLGLR